MKDTEFRETEKPFQFENRKRDHIELALKAENEALGGSLFQHVELLHEALPDLNFSEVRIQARALDQVFRTPFLVSSMTAGHQASVGLNEELAYACAKRGWLMGVGSQRRELSDPEALKEWQQVRKRAPGVHLLGNIGVAQLIQTQTSQIQVLAEALEADAMIVHLNPLQEVLQPEGTTDFKGSWRAIENLVKELGLPVVVKETGCGMSLKTIRRLVELGVSAVDVGGFGGTHWGRIEGGRSSQLTDSQSQILSEVSKTYAQWGHPTAKILAQTSKADFGDRIWASGGVRSGLDAAKALAMGAQIVGLAKPILEAALKGHEALDLKMETLEYELKVALFCTGCSDLTSLRKDSVWRWRHEF